MPIVRPAIAMLLFFPSHCFARLSPSAEKMIANIPKSGGIRDNIKPAIAKPLSGIWITVPQKGQRGSFMDTSFPQFLQIISFCL